VDEKLQRLLGRGDFRKKAGELWRQGELRRKVGGRRRNKLVTGGLRSKVIGGKRRCKE